MKGTHEYAQLGQAKEFPDLIYWIETLWEWDYIEWETMETARFDWGGSRFSFWVNANYFMEGECPAPIRRKIELECTKGKLEYSIACVTKPTN